MPEQPERAEQTDQPAQPAQPPQTEPIEPGGDAACWLGRVCDNCGALIEGSRGVPCWRCGTPWTPS